MLSMKMSRNKVSSETNKATYNDFFCVVYGDGPHRTTKDLPRMYRRASSAQPWVQGTNLDNDLWRQFPDDAYCWRWVDVDNYEHAEYVTIATGPDALYIDWAWP